MASTKSQTVAPQEALDPSSTSSDPLDGGYGRVQVGVCFAINCFTWGQTAVCNVNLSPYPTSVLPSGHSMYTSHTTSNLTPPQKLPPSAMPSSAVSNSPYLCSWHPSNIGRPQTRSKAALQTAGFIVASFATRLRQFYMPQGLLLGVGPGFVSIPFSSIVPQWVVKKPKRGNGNWLG